MDISFDIYNDKGDLVRVALSYYDNTILKDRKNICLR